MIKEFSFNEQSNIGMRQNIIKRVKPDKHTDYMACAQYVDWIPSAFDEKMDSAFIVQEVCLVSKTGHRIC